MNRKYLLIAALALVLAVASGGCYGKVWKVSFAFPANYSDWGQQGYGGSITSLPGLGVKLHSWALNSPVAFNQDFTVTVDFTLYTDEDEKVFFGILIGDDDKFYPTNYLYSTFSDIGEEDAEDWAVLENGTLDHGKVDNGTLPTLMRIGFNRWKLVKTGNRIKVYMNFYKVADFNLSLCTAAYYYINLYSEQLGGDIVFNNIKVDYEGSII